MADGCAPFGLVRKLWTGDRPRLRAHLLRLDAESRRARFARAVSDDFLIRHAEGALAPGSLVFGYVSRGVILGAAELRPLDQKGEAEAAFSVEAPWRQSGIGTALFSRLMLAARNRLLKRLYLNCMAQNRAMQHLARKFDARIVIEAQDGLGVVEAPAPTPSSLIDEAMTDAQTFGAAMLQLPPRWWERPA